MTLWPGELRHWAVTSLCLWRLHAAFVSPAQRNWYRLTLLSLTEPHYGLTLRSVTAVRLKALSSSHRNHSDECRHTHTRSVPHNTQLASGEITAKEILELVRQTLMEMSCLVSSVENRVELMLISSRQRSIPEGICEHLILTSNQFETKRRKKYMALSVRELALCQSNFLLSSGHRGHICKDTLCSPSDRPTTSSSTHFPL